MTASLEPATAFAEYVRGKFDPERPGTFWECELGLIRLVEEGYISAWINDGLRNLIADEHHLGDWLLNEVVLHRDSDCLLSVSLFDSPRRYIHVLPYFAVYLPLNAALACDRYCLPPSYRNDVFDPSLRLEPAGIISVPPRCPLRIESDQFAYDVKIPTPLAVLRFVTAPMRPLEWLFSKSTLQAWQANDADLSYTQLRVAAYVLGKIAHQSSIDPLRRLTEHPHHAVRWSAIQNLGRLNRSEALIKIREATRDPHPHVRRAAQKTLDRLEGKTGKGP